MGATTGLARDAAHMREKGIANFYRSELVLSDRDPHPSPLAHRLLAEAHFRWMRDLGLLQR